MILFMASLMRFRRVMRGRFLAQRRKGVSRFCGFLCAFATKNPPLEKLIRIEATCFRRKVERETYANVEDHKS